MLKPLFLNALPVLFLIGCASSGPPKEEDFHATGPIRTATLSSPPEIVLPSEGDFRDFGFYISSVSRERNGKVKLRAEGTYQGTPAGFEIELGEKWVQGPRDKEAPELRIMAGEAKMRAIIPESTVFLRAMYSEYDQPALAPTMVKSLHLAAMSLTGNPSQLSSGPVKIKMFFESTDKKHYAEFFLHIDLKRRSLELQEKDTDYREQMVRIFSDEKLRNGIDPWAQPVVTKAHTNEEIRKMLKKH